VDWGVGWLPVSAVSRYNLRSGPGGRRRLPFFFSRAGSPQSPGLYRDAIDGLVCPSEEGGKRGPRRPSSNARIQLFSYLSQWKRGAYFLDFLPLEVILEGPFRGHLAAISASPHAGLTGLRSLTLLRGCSVSSRKIAAARRQKGLSFYDDGRVVVSKTTAVSSRRYGDHSAIGYLQRDVGALPPYRRRRTTRFFANFTGYVSSPTLPAYDAAGS